MPTRRPPAPPLSDELRTILLEGPWAVGKVVRDLPSHDELLAIWNAHPELWKARKKPWFAERIWFVNEIRGTNPPRR